MNQQNKEGMIYVSEEEYTKTIQENIDLKASQHDAKKCLQKMVLVYDELEKVGVVDILKKIFNKDDLNIMALMAPIGKLIPKLKKFEDNEIINDVFNEQFFLRAKRAAL